ncbi:MAG TPA: hypothetical protein V6D43_24180 [Candidatus Sericytochromatia bacterium]
MSDCFLHDFPGRSIRLKLLSPEEQEEDIQWAANVMDVLDELGTVIQPLSADIMVGCRDRNLWLLDGSVDPPVPHWFIQASPLPTGVIVKPGLVNARVSQASELSRKTLMDWIQEALQQECPCAKTHQICWHELYIDATRARIADEVPFANRQSFVLDSDRGKFKFPLERRNDGLWVYGPIEELFTEPPFNLSIRNEEGALTIKILIHWSLWTQPNSASYSALNQAISQIVAKGWKLTDSMHLFEV